MDTERIIALQAEAVEAGLNPANPYEIDDYVAERIEQIAVEEAEAAKKAAKKTTKKKASKKS